MSDTPDFTIGQRVRVSPNVTTCESVEAEWLHDESQPARIGIIQVRWRSSQIGVDRHQWFVAFVDDNDQFGNGSSFRSEEIEALAEETPLDV